MYFSFYPHSLRAWALNVLSLLLLLNVEAMGCKQKGPGVKPYLAY